MSGFKVGQQVYCLRFGEGEIIDIDNTELYSIKAHFLNVKVTYTSEGKMRSDDATPMLYPSKPEIILPKWQPKPGEWCWFWDSTDFPPCLGQFEEMNDRKYRDRDRENCNWNYCEPFIGELPSYLKEVQP